MGRIVDRIGLTYGYLTIIHRKSVNGQTVYKCRCICGIEKDVYCSSLRSGSTKSCGCKKKELSSSAHKKHGHTAGGILSLTFKTWSSMRARCLNKANKDFPRYGGRGIVICDRWLNFKNFLIDMGERPGKEYSIDRIDPLKGYEPGNCRWATAKTQSINCLKRSNTTSMYKGVSYCSRMYPRPWKCSISVGDKEKHLGYFEHEIDAAKAYDEAAFIVHGKDARVNFM